jgi:hypothetical protein
MSQQVLLYNHSLDKSFGCWVDDSVYLFGPRQMIQVSPELATRILDYAKANDIPVSAELPDVVVINGRQYVPIEKIFNNSPAPSDIGATPQPTTTTPKGKSK